MFAPAHPCEILKEDVLAEAGLSIGKAAEILGVGRPALSAVLNGRASLSPEMALRFEKAFGVSMDLMLKMQLQYDIAKTRKLAKGIKVMKWKRAALKSLRHFNGPADAHAKQLRHCEGTKG